MPGSGSPFRARPGMPGPQKPKGKFMADGGLGTPEPIGGPASMGPPPGAMPGKMPPPAPGGADPDKDGDIDSPSVSPEAVHYHDDAQSCSGCSFMGADQQCEVLKMQVSPDGGCAAFQAKTDQGDGMSDGAMPGGDQGGDDMGPGGAGGGY